MRLIYIKTVCLITLLSLPASAAVLTTFNDRTTFLGAVSNPVTAAFTGPDGTSVGSAAGLTISTMGGDPNGLIDENALCGSQLGTVDCFQPLVFTPTLPLFAFGFDNLDLTTNEEFVVILNFVNGDPQQTFNFSLNGQPALTPVFFGAISDSAISQFQVYSRDIGSTSVGLRANVIDNLTTADPGKGDSDIPEPSTALLALAGGLLLFSGRRRLTQS